MGGREIIIELERYERLIAAWSFWCNKPSDDSRNRSGRLRLGMLMSSYESRTFDEGYGDEINKLGSAKGCLEVGQDVSVR